MDHTFLKTVRAATRSHHDELEEVINLDALAGSVDSYRQVLAAFYGVWLPLEVMLADSGLAGDPVIEISKRRRAEKIALDLRSLGLRPAEIERIPLSEPPFEVGSEAAAAGVLYVLEGSTLGGKLIVARVREGLQLTPQNGAAFFHGHGESNVPMWRSFCAWADQKFIGEDADTAAEAACQTFQLFIDWCGSRVQPEVQLKG